MEEELLISSSTITAPASPSNLEDTLRAMVSNIILGQYGMNLTFKVVNQILTPILPDSRTIASSFSFFSSSVPFSILSEGLEDFLVKSSFPSHIYF